MMSQVNSLNSLYFFVIFFNFFSVDIIKREIKDIQGGKVGCT